MSFGDAGEAGVGGPVRKTCPAQPPTFWCQGSAPPAPFSPLGAQDLPSQLNPEPQPGLPRGFGTRGRPRLVVVPLLVFFLVLLVFLLVAAMAARLGLLPCEERHRVKRRVPAGSAPPESDPAVPLALPRPRALSPWPPASIPPRRQALRIRLRGTQFGGDPLPPGTRFRPASLPPVLRGG